MRSPEKILNTQCIAHLDPLIDTSIIQIGHYNLLFIFFILFWWGLAQCLLKMSKSITEF